MKKNVFTIIKTVNGVDYPCYETHYKKSACEASIKKQMNYKRNKSGNVSFRIEEIENPY